MSTQATARALPGVRRRRPPPRLLIYLALWCADSASWFVLFLLRAFDGEVSLITAAALLFSVWNFHTTWRSLQGALKLYDADRQLWNPTPGQWRYLGFSITLLVVCYIVSFS